MNKIKVLIADDSALMRKLLSDILNQDPAIEVVGAVGDAYKAREEIKRLNPDVLTLDVEMPRMDGISFLERLMRLRPMPVVMISAMTQQGADTTMKALMLGAVDFISKPRIDVENNLIQYGDLICEKVKTAAESRLNRSNVSPSSPSTKKSSGTVPKSASCSIIAIGASTGGVETIHQLLSDLPVGLPPIVIAQHIPPVFSKSFASRLDAQVDLNVCEVDAGQKLEHGGVYIAPGDKHLIVRKSGGNYVADLDDHAPVNRHMPSVEVLFDSVAQAAGRRAIGIMLTGMGNDGARGLLNMHNKGALTIAQDQHSSVVWGMPREAIELGAAEHIVALNKIPAVIVAHCDNKLTKGELDGRSRTSAATSG